MLFSRTSYLLIYIIGYQKKKLDLNKIYYLIIMLLFSIERHYNLNNIVC